MCDAFLLPFTNWNVSYAPRASYWCALAIWEDGLKISAPITMFNMCCNLRPRSKYYAHTHIHETWNAAMFNVFLFFVYDMTSQFIAS